MASHLDLEEQEQLEQLKAFWKRWGNLITWLVTAALAVAAAWMGWNWWQREQGAKASGLLEELQTQVEAGDAGKVAGAFAALQDKFPSTAAAAQGALAAARFQHDKQDDAKAIAALSWAADHAVEPYQEVARLRLAGLQADAKQYDQALKTLDGIKSADFAALVADRRGDIALLQKQPEQAKAEFLKAYKAMDKKLDYRGLVAAKLATLGVEAPDDKPTTESSK